MNQTFDDASNIQHQLTESATALSKASETLEQIRLLKRELVKEIELRKADMFAEQSALGEDGLFKGKTNKESREALFDSFVKKSDLPAVRELAQCETQEVNAKIQEIAASNHFDALKKVADLQIRKLEYETQSVALQMILKQLETQKKI